MTPYEYILNNIYTYVDIMFAQVKNLQIRRRKCNVANMFSLMIHASHTNNNDKSFKNLYTSNRNLSDGAYTYWKTKIYSLNFVDNFHSIAVDNNFYKHKLNNNFMGLFDKYNILAGDGTKVKCAYKICDNQGKNIAAINIVAIYDIRYGTFRDYKIAYDCNEHTGILQHDLTKNDLIILDRYYASHELMNILKKKTTFLIRLKLNLLCVKKFMLDTNTTEKVVNYSGTRIKLVKYWIDKKTKNIILNKYKDIDDKNDDDMSDCYVVATNDTTLSANECIFLYKKRWSIETSFKQLKQNFKIRYVNKQITTKTPLLKTEFWFRMSFLMYNMTSVLKNSIDASQQNECKFSECAIFICDTITGILKISNLKDDLKTLITKTYYTTTRIKKITRCIKPGVYKSIVTIDASNKKLIQKDNG